MTRRRSSESVSISSIISDTRDLLRRLEEVEPVIKHHERVQGGGKRRAAAKQPIDKKRFIAIFREISQKAQAYIARFEEQETHDDETHDDEPHDDETHKTRDEETLNNKTHETPDDDETPDDETPNETPNETPHETPHKTPHKTHVEETHNSTRALEIRFPCQLSQLGINMVGTIQEARDKLVLQDVNERGYLILEVQGTWDPLELTKLLRTAKAPGRDEIKGFNYAQGTSGCLHARVARNISLSL